MTRRTSRCYSYAPCPIEMKAAPPYSDVTAEGHWIKRRAFHSDYVELDFSINSDFSKRCLGRLSNGFGGLG
jgi:hypothetical protein